VPGIFYGQALSSQINLKISINIKRLIISLGPGTSVGKIIFGEMFSK
jgi:hypothetical protein